MNSRNTILAAAVGVLVVLAGWWFLLYSPALAEEEQVEQEIAGLDAQVAQLQVDIERRRAVRNDAPSVEADLARYRSLIPDSPDLPALLRQLQFAADESGLDLTSVSPGEPAVIEGVTDVSVMSLAMQVDGSYFQLVDFLRRVEDPDIVARVLLVDSLDVLLADVDDYPTLQTSISGRVFTTAPAEGVDPAPVPTETPTDGATSGATEAPTTEATP